MSKNNKQDNNWLVDGIGTLIALCFVTLLLAVTIKILMWLVAL